MSNPKANPEVELKQLKDTVSCVSGIIQAQEEVHEKYKVSPYDNDFPMEEIKNSTGMEAVRSIQTILDNAQDKTPEFLSGLLISKHQLGEFFYQIDRLCELAIRAEKHQYCDLQKFQASNEAMGATLCAILNHIDKGKTDETDNS